MFEHHEVDHDHSIESETNGGGIPETGASNTPQDGFSDHEGGMNHAPESHEFDQIDPGHFKPDSSEQPCIEDQGACSQELSESPQFEADADHSDAVTDTGTDAEAGVDHSDAFTDAGADTEADADTNMVSQGKSAEVLDLIAGVESQLEKMRNAQNACVEEIDSIENRRQEISNRENEISELGREFESKNSDFETRVAEFDDRERHLEQRQATIELTMNELETRERGFEERNSQFQQVQAGIDATRQQIDSDRAILSRDRETFDQERQSLVNERTAVSAELASLKNSFEMMENEYIALGVEREALSNRVDELNESFEQVTSRVNDAEGKAGILENEMTDLTSKLDQAATAIEDRDARLSEREETVAQFKEKVGSLESERGELHGRIEKREIELDELQGNLVIATDRLQSLAEAVAEQAPRLEEGATAVALCRQQEQRLKTLSQDLTEARAEIGRVQSAKDPDGILAGAREELQRVRMEIEEMIPLDEHRRVVSSLEAKCAKGVEAGGGVDPAVSVELRTQLDKAKTEFVALSTHAEGCEEALKEAESRIADLQSANKVLKQADVAGGADVSDDTERLREQANRLADFAMHLQRRRSRLKSMRSAMSTRQQFSSDTMSATVGSIESEQRDKMMEEDILRRQHELVDLESRMIRRWARQGTVGIVARVTVLAIALAAASWFGVRWFAPGNVTATALIKAQPVAGQIMDDERATAWNTWHKSIVNDKLFAKAVSTRLASMPGGYDGGTEGVQKIIANDLSIEEIQPGMLSFNLDGLDRTESVRVLEAVVATLASESQRQLPRRGDGARVDVLTHDGRIASLAPVPVTSSQVQYAGMVFGGSLGLIGLMGAAVYSRLSRTRRLFDENLGIDETEMI
jgi:chromosome segregation ATPase